MLDGLELGDREAELLAFQRVVDAQPDQLAGGAEGVRSEPHETRVDHSLGDRAVLRSREHLGVRVLEHQPVDRAAAVDAVQGFVSGAGRRAVRPVEDGKAAAFQAHHDEVGGFELWHPGLFAAEPASGFAHAPLVWLPGRGLLVALLAEGHGRDPLPAGQLGKPARALLLASGPGNREARESVLKNRSGKTGTAGDFAGEGQLEHTEARAPVVLGHHESADAHLGQALPDRVVLPLASVEDLAQALRRKFRGREVPQCLLEQLLLLAQPEVQRGYLLVRFGSGEGRAF